MLQQGTGAGLSCDAPVDVTTGIVPGAQIVVSIAAGCVYHREVMRIESLQMTHAGDGDSIQLVASNLGAGVIEGN
jgi:hypothetical protein